MATINGSGHCAIPTTYGIKKVTNAQIHRNNSFGDANGQKMIDANEKRERKPWKSNKKPLPTTANPYIRTCTEDAKQQRLGTVALHENLLKPTRHQVSRAKRT